MKKEFRLLFKDMNSGETWEHLTNDWILNFCNFNSNIHPSQLRPGQSIVVKAADGNRVEIKCERKQS